MTYTEFIRRSITFVFIVVAAIVIVLIAVRVYPILVIGLLSWIISVGLSIPINFFRRQGLKRGMAVALTFVLAVVFIVLFVRLLLPPLVSQINSLASELPAAGESAVQSYNDFRSGSDLLSGVLPEFTVEDYQNLLGESAGESTFDFTSVAGSALPLIANVGGFLANIFLNLFLIFFITIYLTLDPMIYYRMVLALTPIQSEKRALEILENVRQTVVAWVGSMVLEVTITAIMVTVALGVLLQLPNAIALGVLAGLGNIVPYVGYWAALIPIVIFAAAVGGPGTAALAFVLYFAIGIIEANVILPANMGKSLKLPAALILIFQGVASSLLGFWGVLLAVPILAIVTVLLRELFVFDALGKRGRVPHVLETPTGELILDEGAPDVPAEEASQDTSLTEADPEPPTLPPGKTGT
jgi:predicted PurR-regulated permease PerM